MDEFVFAAREVSSDFLVARPSGRSGLARLLDLFAGFDGYNTSRDGVAADGKAMRADWLVIGQDLKVAVSRFRADHPSVAGSER